MNIIFINQENDDNMVSEIGMRQICRTVYWFEQNMNLSNYIGYTSPYKNNLQLSSAFQTFFDLKIHVNDNLIPKLNKNIKIKNEQLLFQNLIWNKEWFDYDYKSYDKEDNTSYLNRVESFYNQNKENSIVFAHSLTILLLINLYLNNNINKCFDKEEVIDNESDLINYYLNVPLSSCGVTIIESGKLKILNKTFY